MADNTQQQKGAQNELDIVWLIAYMWDKRRLICKIVAAVTILSVIIYFSRPKVFTAEASILPMTKSGSSSLGGMKGLASLVGVDINSMTDSRDAITPDIYAEVVSSTPAMLEIMSNVPLTWDDPVDSVMTLYDHAKADTIMSVGETIAKYTIHLPGTIISAIRGEEPAMETVMGNGRPVVLDKWQRDCVKWLQQRITVTPDEEVNLVRITAQGGNREQSAELASAAMEQLQKSITAFSTANSLRSLRILKARYDSIFTEFTRARQEYFAYLDSHRNLVEERTGVRRQTLEDEYTSKQSLLTTLQGQVEQMRMAVLTETPAFSVVQPVVVPHKKTSPKLMWHLIGGVVGGGVVAIGWLLLQLGYLQVFKPKEFKRVYTEYQREEDE